MSHICHCICNYVIWDKYLMAHMYQRVYQSPTTSRGWLDGGWNYKSLVAMANQSTIYIYIYGPIYTYNVCIHFPTLCDFCSYSIQQHGFCCEKTSQTFPSCICWILRVKNPPLDPPSQPKSQLCSWKQVWARREQPWMLGETTRLEMVSRQEMDMYLPHGLK